MLGYHDQLVGRLLVPANVIAPHVLGAGCGPLSWHNISF